MSSIVREPADDPAFDKLLSNRPAVVKRLAETKAARELGLLLVRLRRRAGLSQLELSRRADWNPAYVSRLETGRAPLPETATIARYADACSAEVEIVLRDAAGVVGRLALTRSPVPDAPSTPAKESSRGNPAARTAEHKMRKADTPPVVAPVSRRQREFAG